MDGHDDPTPTRLWFSLLRRLGRGLTGRRVAVQGTSFTVASVHGCPDGWSLGRARDVQLTLHDVVAPEITAQELVVECDTLTVGSTVTATGVTVTATLSSSAFASFGDGTEGPRVTVEDGELRTAWWPGITLALRPEVTADELRFTPVAVVTPLGRWSSWGLLPSGSVPSPVLPGGLRVTDIATTGDVVVVRSATEHWTASAADRPRLRELLAAA
ncbi:hypothetical protein [Actinomycetospora termitidis]|uniref:Urease accessory protein n=1 Tax=Actinomycetospora termitidis TaxID=3053470 RepID=A0ABT7MJ01_9PSEU|nr:hypothetical protein [Actinomycetospora sp. Odt1-22]MDL5160184.1 hypothetical protein [Actinomycetospora sp. Odt1-22]